MSNTLKAVIVIVSHDRCHLLERTLASLAEGDIPPEHSETLVVENGRQFGAEQVVAAAHTRLRARYLFEPSSSKARALNRALEQTSDAFIVYLDDDIRVASHTVRRYIDAAATYPRGFYFGGPTGVDYEQEPPVWLREHMPASATGFSMGEATRQVDRPCFLGFNWAAFAADIRRVGGFPEHIGPGTSQGQTIGEESEVQRKLLATGMTGLYLPEAMVWHHVPQDRCTTAWVNKRCHTSGLVTGIQEDRRSIASLISAVFRIPVFLCLSIVLAPCWIARWRWWPRFKLAYYTGFLQGRYRRLRSA
jgi:glycosyltransferase involved in cell wall biosynthesis